MRFWSITHSFFHCGRFWKDKFCRISLPGLQPCGGHCCESKQVTADVFQALQVLNINELSQPGLWYWTPRSQRGCVCVCFVCLFCLCVSDLWRSTQALTVWWSSLCANSHPTLCLLLRQGVVWSGTAGPQVQTSLLPLPGSWDLWGPSCNPLPACTPPPPRLFFSFFRILNFFLLICRPVTGRAARQHGHYPCTDAPDEVGGWLVDWSICKASQEGF